MRSQPKTAEQAWEQVGKERVLVELEDERRYYKWHPGRVELDPVAGTITIYGKLAVTIRASKITHCEIVEREGINYLSLALEGSGCFTELADVLLLGFITIIEGAIAKKTRVPVIKLAQSASDDSEQGWVIHLCSKRRGERGRAATFEMAHCILTFLRENGYKGALPEELSGSTAPQPQLDNKWAGIAFRDGGIFAIGIVYVAGVFVGIYRTWPDLSFSDFIRIVSDVYLGLTLICGLPVLVLGTIALQNARRRFIAKELSRSKVIITITVSAICSFAVGCLAGMFMVLDLSH